MKSVGISDQGLIRHRNEDNFLIEEPRGLFVVCDGMGGHKSGHVASNLAIEIIAEQTKNLKSKEIINLIDEIIIKANRKIWEIGQSDPECHEMGTTITAAIIDNDKLYISHIGDSRLYIIREDKIRQVTKDHTLAEQMIENGLLEENELSNVSYSHILTRALGIAEDIEIDHYIETLLDDDIILLCTDGLSDMLSDEDILTIILSSANEDIEKIAQQLVDKALEKGGHDNITLILIRM